MHLTEEDLKELTDTDLAAVTGRQKWIDISRPKQIPPAGNWTQLLYSAGRGFGKTLSEVEWAWWEGWRTGKPIIIHAVAPTLGDLNKVLFEGPAGFQAVIPPECLLGGTWDRAFNSTDHYLVLSNGTKVQGFGAQDGGGRLRGPQCHCAIGDELREWDRPAGNLEFVHTNLMFGCRLPMPDGSFSRAVFGTTPKAIPYLRALQKQRGVIVVRGTTYENLTNLAQSFRDVILSKEGTKIGKQEIHAEDLDDDESAIFKRNWIRLWPPNKKLPEFTYIIMSLDTAYEEENIDVKGQKDPDYSACGVFGVFNVNQCFTEEERKKLRVKSKYAIVLADFWQERLGFPDLLERTRQTYRTQWGSPGRRPDLVVIESKASGISLRQTLSVYGVPTAKFDGHGQSKTMRAHTVSPLVAQGMLFMPESAREDRAGQVRDWCEDLFDQLTTFAGEGTTEYDDGVDITVQALMVLNEQGYFAAEPQGRAFPDMDEKDEQDRQRATEIARKEKKRKTGNPYE